MSLYNLYLVEDEADFEEILISTYIDWNNKNIWMKLQTANVAEYIQTAEELEEKREHVVGCRVGNMPIWHAVNSGSSRDRGYT